MVPDFAMLIAMSISFLHFLALSTSFAARFQIPGSNITPTSLIDKIVTTLTTVSLSVCTAIFVVGGLFMLFAAGKEDTIQKGRTMMIGSAIGLAVITGSYVILKT